MKIHWNFTCMLLLLAGCAGQQPPVGGPVDSVPPEIISVFPQPNTVNFSEKSIIIEFSEYVDRRSAEESIFISPGIEQKEFEWSGTELEIVINEPLRKNTTYVVSVGTDVADVRAGNRMAQAFTLSFSTGPAIDNGTVEGKVFDEVADGVMIFSYRLNEIKADTLNPAVTKPDYLTQTGKSGDFVLRNMAPGTYRILAVRDQVKNYLYDPETDAAGTTDDVTISAKDSLRTNIAFIVATEDTTTPRLSSVSVPDQRHIVVQLSEPLDSASVRLSSFSVTDTNYQKELPIRYLFPSNENYTSVTLVTDTMTSNERYVVTVHSLKDRAGFPINPIARSKQFTGTGVRDTVPPVLNGSAVSNPSSTLFPDERIGLSFTDAVPGPLADSTITIRRIADSSIVPAVILYRNSAALDLVPRSPLRPGEQYLVRLMLQGIMDHAGNVYRDSLLTVKFSVDDPENYGSVEGKVAGYSAGATIIQADNIIDKKQKAKKTIVSPTGVFSITRLPEGRYTMKAFNDINNNAVLDAGTVFPYRRAERFSTYKDTIRVRARWPVEGVLFKVQ